ncbi:hypothetical protein [Flavobacterium saliperosum]|uniref:Uncharacterized protein n=1 Tax=Flavobacterium saliperosum TaxID=329186 RepID=A0A1G4WAL4_9FLAO|nr:hypothetical protein [Flavobacterium saliperosum]SCX19533.1 hypothetical protein SAMN02927925_02804 [Flavobacterium saliperosum]
MNNRIFLVAGIIIFSINIFFIGLLKNNVQNRAELFFKHKPSLEMFFSSENNLKNTIDKKETEKEKIYKEYITDYNIEDQYKSFFTFMSIQLMMSCLILGFSKIDNFKIQLALFGAHFVLGLIATFLIIDYAMNQTNNLFSIMILLSVVGLEIIMMRGFTK